MSPVELASGYALGAVASVGAGGSLSVQIRALLAVAGNSTDQYYAVVTYHALLMIFGWLMPVLFGVIANALVPTIVGLNDLLLPRLNSAGLWLLLDAVALLLAAQARPVGVGWTLYPPLSLNEGPGVDWCIIALHLAGFSSLVLAVNLMSTSFGGYQARLPWRSLSLVVWATAVANVLLILTLPALAAAVTMLLLDRRVNAGFYSVDHGGDPVLYQHLFWFFGHPEVYVLVLPAFGYISHILVTDARAVITSPLNMLTALLCIGSISMVVYGHHLYTTGLDADHRSYFTFATLMIGLPTGVKYFTWISTFNVTYLTTQLPVQAAIGFMWFFAVGGLTGIVLADGALDATMHDAYYVVSHFHVIMAVAIMYATAGMVLHLAGSLWS